MLNTHSCESDLRSPFWGTKSVELVLSNVCALGLWDTVPLLGGTGGGVECLVEGGTDEGWSGKEEECEGNEDH